MVWRWGEREIIYLSLHCHHQNNSRIKMGSDESHFNISIGSDGQSHKTVSTNHNLFEEKGEPKRYGTEVLPLTNLTPLLLGQTGSRRTDGVFLLCTVRGACHCVLKEDWWEIMLNEPRGQIISRKTEIVSFFKLLFSFVKGTSVKDGFIFPCSFCGK